MDPRRKQSEYDIESDHTTIPNIQNHSSEKQQFSRLCFDEKMRILSEEEVLEEVKTQSYEEPIEFRTKKLSKKDKFVSVDI